MIYYKLFTDIFLVAFIKLLVDEDDIYRAAEEVAAASPKECALTAVDCTIPLLTEKITDELEDGNMDAVRELSIQLKRLSDNGGIPTCKAMLESAPEDISLEDALDLAYQTGEFRLLREIASPQDYAQAELSRCDIPLKEELLQSQDLYRYGEKLMEHNKAAASDYGILYSPSSQTVEQCLNRPESHLEMR